MTPRTYYAVQQWKQGKWRHVGVHQRTKKEAVAEYLRIRFLLGPNAAIRIEPVAERGEKGRR